MLGIDAFGHWVKTVEREGKLHGWFFSDIDDEYPTECDFKWVIRGCWASARDDDEDNEDVNGEGLNGFRQWYELFSFMK